MAIYHLSAKIISRKAGRSSTAAAAYRAGEEIVDERTGEVHDYRRKGGVEHTEIVLPSSSDWEPTRAELWNAAELKNKRQDAQVAREFVVALPDELAPVERQRLAVDFAREIADRYSVAADVAIHAPSRHGDDRNHHAHILTTTNRVEGHTLGNKARELDLVAHNMGGKLGQANEIDRLRERWAELTNTALERAGVAERVDHRTLKAQGIDREPTRHLGPAASEYEQRTGESSRIRMDFDQAVAERLASAKAAGELERQGHQLDRSIFDLSGDLKTALAERDRQQRAEQDKRDQEERQRRATERMSAAELAAEIARLRPLPVGDVAKRQPEVIAAAQAHQALLQQHADAQARQAQARQDAQAWRAEHPIRAKGHDTGAWKSDYLAEREQAEASAKAQARMLALQHDGTSRKSSAAEAEAVARVKQEQAPARARVAELERALAERRDREERERAEKLRQEEQQRAERDLKCNIAEVLVYAAAMHQEGRLVLPEGSMGVAVGRVLQAIGTERGEAQMREDLDGPNAKILQTFAREVVPQVAKQIQAERDQQEKERDSGPSL
jgi:hypothetical protein